METLRETMKRENERVADELLSIIGNEDDAWPYEFIEYPTHNRYRIWEGVCETTIEGLKTIKEILTKIGQRGVLMVWSSLENEYGTKYGRTLNWAVVGDIPTEFVDSVLNDEYYNEQEKTNPYDIYDRVQWGTEVK